MVHVNITDGNTDGNIIGQSTTDKIGFYGTVPIVQRASSLQDTALITSSADYTALHASIMCEIMDTLAALGLWKGSA